MFAANTMATRATAAIAMFLRFPVYEATPRPRDFAGLLKTSWIRARSASSSMSRRRPPSLRRTSPSSRFRPDRYNAVREPQKGQIPVEPPPRVLLSEQDQEEAIASITPPSCDRRAPFLPAVVLRRSARDDKSPQWILSPSPYLPSWSPHQGRRSS